MERTLIEHEIRKYNPHQIHYYDSRVIEWDNENPILSNELMKELLDDEIEELYVNYPSTAKPMDGFQIQRK